MKRHLSARAINRARWISELFGALDEGERLLEELIAKQVSPIDTERRRLRLIDLRQELLQLNRVALDEDRVVGSTWPEQKGET
jgi:hypothetical protein